MSSIKVTPSMLDRRYEESPYLRVQGFSFTTGYTITTALEGLYDIASDTVYWWAGALPKVVPALSDPASTGGIGAGAWEDVSSKYIRSAQGASIVGALDGGFVQDYLSAGDNLVVVDHPPYNGDLVAAYNAISIAGNTTLLCGHRTYSAVGMPTITKPNISIIGTKVPAFDSVLNKLTEGSGTVIQGDIHSSAKGFAIHNLGIDHGEWVRANVFAGVYGDTLVCDDFGNDANVRYGDLIILESIHDSMEPTSLTHCILIENGSGVRQTGPVEVIYGYHGNTIKVADYFSDAPTIGRYQAGDIVTVKRDAGAATENVTVGDVFIDGDSGTESSGVSYECVVGNMDKVSFGRVYGRNCRWGVKHITTGGTVSNVTFESIDVSSVTGDGAAAAIDIGSTTINCRIGSHAVSGCAVIGVRTQAGCVNVDIGHGYAKECTDGYNLAGDVSHGNLNTTGNTAYGVNFNGYYGIGSGAPVTSGIKVNPDLITGESNVLGMFNAFPSGLGSLNTTWVQTADNSFKVQRCGNKVRITGKLAKGGAPTSAAATILAGSRPAVKTPVSAFGLNGGAVLVPVECYVLTDGTLDVPGYAVVASTVSFVCEYTAAQ